ncbi:MAG TPA: chloramphenicol acetyltransferase [Saprospiraceae bacterium]|nr:chloramphenicol acetyltransferase [Saprospiraceae bacterium]HMQ85073.1 chloramphenicol acetyltransferase [Saprospiraceae bacterium]
MKKITFSDPHRQKHFDFFRRMDQPHFSVTANVDITRFRAIQAEQQLSFTSSVVYLISRTANDIPVFRQRIRGPEVVEHKLVHPSFAVLTEVSDVFSFCTVTYQRDFQAFSSDALAQMARMKTNPVLEDEPGRDDFLFLSTLPWVSFTTITHAMHYSPVDSVPRIVWGKFFPEGDRLKMPLSVQAHHALVDGRHVGEYFQKIQDLLDGFLEFT